MYYSMDIIIRRDINMNHSRRTIDTQRTLINARIDILRR